MSSRIHFLERDAVISECGRYRYLLRRAWDYDLPRALTVMLNPSTADAEVDDATIRSLYRLLRPKGYGSFEVVNLYGFRATNPQDLERANSPIGDRNDDIVKAAVERCDIPICAWGSHKMARRRETSMVGLIRSIRLAVFCFGTTKDGAPKHPLYLKTATPLVAFQ